jgi:hypothetical protein
MKSRVRRQVRSGRKSRVRRQVRSGRKSRVSRAGEIR